MSPHDRGLRSQSTLGGHPVHPMLVPFPIAFLVGALFTDIAYASSADPFWARAAAWLIGAGFVTGVAAAVFGLVDFLFVRRVRALKAAWFHFVGNAAVLMIALWNGALRIDNAADAVLPTGIILSAVTTVLLLATGWFGGELAYKHKIGAVDGEPTGLDAAAHPPRAPSAASDSPYHGAPHAQAEAERRPQQGG
jgi:uncharacterized membrane protein